MKNYKNLLVAGVIAMSFASCAHYSVDAPVMGISSNSINTYVAADLDYKNAKQVSAEVESQVLFGCLNLIHNADKQLVNSNRYKGLSKVERQALYKVKVENDVDIIMEPEFTVEKHSWFFGAYSTRKVSVKGWGVKMKGLKEDPFGVTNSTREFSASGLGGLFK